MNRSRIAAVEIYSYAIPAIRQQTRVSRLLKVRRQSHLSDRYNFQMSRFSAGISAIAFIDRDEATPLHKQIYDAYRGAILRGDLSPGQQVPSSRELAKEIQVSRFPVLHPYAQLLAEGYIESRIGAGTFVSNSLPEQLMSIERKASPSRAMPSGPRPVARRSPAVSEIRKFFFAAQLGCILGCINLPLINSRSRYGRILLLVTAGIQEQMQFITSTRLGLNGSARSSASISGARAP